MKIGIVSCDELKAHERDRPGELKLEPEGSNPTTCALAELQAYGRRSTAGWLGLRDYYGA